MTAPASAAVPTLISLLICDQVIDDKLTSKKSAIGLFNTILVGAVPTAIHQMAVLATLTELTRPMRVELRLVRDADNAVIFSTTTPDPVQAPNPLAMVDLVFNLQGVQLAMGGQYAFEMLCGNELLARRRFQVVVRPWNTPDATSPGTL